MERLYHRVQLAKAKAGSVWEDRRSQQSGLCDSDSQDKGPSQIQCGEGHSQPECLLIALQVIIMMPPQVLISGLLLLLPGK